MLPIMKTKIIACIVYIFVLEQLISLMSLSLNLIVIS